MPIRPYVGYFSWYFQPHQIVFPEEYAVFKPQGINNEVFILKNEEKDVWKPVNDEGIMQAVFCEYVESLIPDCVEVGYETEDSEY